MPLLVIGNKNYSSWSLRPWLALKHAGVDFEELRIPLDTPEFAWQVAEHSPAGRVPIWKDGDLVLWESLAIIEHVADDNPILWPEDRAAKARCRVVSCEMLAGFQALRNEMPMNIRATGRRVAASKRCAADIARIEAMIRALRREHEAAGPWLFGRFSVADAMYAPVLWRFHCYGVALEPTLAAYWRTLRDDPHMAAWAEDARAEIEVVEADEAG